MRTLALLIFLMAIPSSVLAQGFISPVDGISAQTPSYVILPDGTKIEGTVPLAMFMNGTLRSITLKTADGEKAKYKAADVKVLANKPSALAKMSAMSDQVDSLRDLITADWGEVMQREWVMFEQALLPGKGDKYALMQLINPGFDSRISVYFDAKAASNDDSVMGISTAPAESYIVVKDGKRSVQVKKSGYKKNMFDELFADCAPLMKSAVAEKPKFKNFALHVYAYDQACGKK